MINIIHYSYWILLLPLFSFIVNGLYLGKRNKQAAGILSTALTVASAIIACITALIFFNTSPGELRILWDIPFLSFSDTLVAKAGMLLDPVSVMMILVVTVISALVHIYSLEYMKTDPSSGRFFTFLSLFTFSMLGLVIATNLFQMFFFWELVGICSYLLIGFWYQKPSAVSASKQAFILTRFADSFFLLGIVLVSYIVGSFDFSALNALTLADFSNSSIHLGIAEFSKAQALLAGSVLIFIGGWGKSALFPMHIWLPNAMEGPTPVSAIIHSATMVVAGVYLVARLFPFFALNESLLQLILVLGIITALFAAIIACTQKDIKRILAYSTLSQIGYMMFALGSTNIVGESTLNALGYSASTFHIFTHAFFKCMLFLVAGVVIHAVHSNSLESMGGLRSKMPWTYAASLAACLAISGIPPFSGFFSKDEILIATLQSGHTLVFALALFTSALTAFYMFRLFFLTFHGKPRYEHSNPIKERFLTTLPIVLLAVPAIFAGWAKPIFLRDFIPQNASAIFSGTLPHYSFIPIMATILSLAAIGFAWFLYCSRGAKVSKALDSDNRSKLYKIVYHKFYFDEIYSTIVREFIFRGIADFIKWFDEKIIGSLVKLITLSFQKAGSLVRRLQSGYLPFYLGTLIVGLLLWRYLGNIPL